MSFVKKNSNNRARMLAYRRILFCSEQPNIFFKKIPVAYAQTADRSTGHISLSIRRADEHKSRTHRYTSRSQTHRLSQLTRKSFFFLFFRKRLQEHKVTNQNIHLTQFRIYERRAGTCLPEYLLVSYFIQLSSKYLSFQDAIR